MSEPSEASRDEFAKELDVLDALRKMAHANFPRTTKINLETQGSSPKASHQISAYLLDYMIESARQRLGALP